MCSDQGEHSKGTSEVQMQDKVHIVHHSYRLSWKAQDYLNYQHLKTRFVFVMVVVKCLANKLFTNDTMLG